MNRAAGNGHLEVVQWLHKNRREGCSRDAMDTAAANGHFEIVKFLHKNRREGCTVRTMNDTVKKGRLDIVRWLYANRSEGCTGMAMLSAIYRDNFDLVQFLATHCADQIEYPSEDVRLGSASPELQQWVAEHRWSDNQALGGDIPNHTGANVSCVYLA